MTLDIHPSVRCTLVQAATDPPYIGRGKVLSCEDPRLVLEVEGPQPAFGASVVIEFEPSSGAPRLIAHIVATEGSHVSLDVHRIAAPDKREYPRIDGPLHVRYHVSPNGARAVAPWLAGGPATGREYVPDPYMNLSVTGLQFEDLPHCREDDTMLLSFQLPQESGVWRAVGRVVRVQQIPVDERDDSIVATHRIAVHFTDLPPAAAEALSRHTLRIQDAWLRNRDDAS